MSDFGDLTLGAWLNSEHERLLEFARFWRVGAIGGDPHGPKEAFPLKMSAGEWDENYRSWGGA